VSFQSVLLAAALRVMRRKWQAPLDPAWMRATTSRTARRLPVSPRALVRHQPVDGVDAFWFEPPNARPHKAMLYLHGGGYVFGSAQDTHRDLISRLAQTAECCVLAVDYRLAPEHPYPAALDDVLKAYRWLLAAGHAPRNIAVAGDSAGGGLAFALMLKLLAGGEPVPAALVTISPWTDLALTGASIAENAGRDMLIAEHHLVRAAAFYVGDADPRDPLISPLYGDVAHLPPTLIQVGSEESLVDDSRRMAARLKAAGVPVVMEEWRRMPHVWHLFARFLPEARAAIDHIGLFLRGHMYGD
jgi:monoterpene epsilon-lactone hydrolase